MTDRLEQLVREAQQRRAAHAPDPDRVRRALPGLAARRTRRRRAGAAGGAALAVLALAAAALWWPVAGGPPDRIPADEVPPPSASASASGVPPVAPDVELSYAPGWLPPGFHERLRGASLNDAGIPGVKVIRTWTKASAAGGEAPFIRVVLQPTPQLIPGVPVTAEGVTGSYEGPTADFAYGRLGWPVDPRHAVVIESNSVTSQADLLRVATSLYPDTTPIVQPLVIGWAPFEHREYGYSYGGDDPASWSARVTLDGPSGLPDNVSVELGPGTNVPEGGKPVEVAGVAGRLVVEDGSTGHNPRQCVVLPPPAGRYLLTVCNYTAGPDGARMPEDQLLRVAGSVDTRMRASTDWLG